MGFNSYKYVYEHVHELKVSAPEVSVLYALAYIRNESTGECFPSHQHLSRITKFSRTTVKSSLQSLKKKGLVDWTSSHKHANSYRLTFLKLEAACQTACPGAQARTPVPPELAQDIDDLAARFADLCNNPDNWLHNRNSFRSQIRMRNFVLCDELYCKFAAEKDVHEHEKANNLGSIMMSKLKEIPVLECYQQPAIWQRPDGREPSTGRAGAVHPDGRKPSA